MKLSSMLVALCVATAVVSCSSYGNSTDEGSDDPAYVGPGTGGNNNDDDDAQPPGYSTPSASAAGSDSTAVK